MIQRQQQIQTQVGAKEVWALERYAHTIGTCRMGDDPASSVVDADCLAHDVPGLHIVDNSVFPSALTINPALSVNPALTIVALSLRTADRLLRRRAILGREACFQHVEKRVSSRRRAFLVLGYKTNKRKQQLLTAKHGK